MQLGIEQGLLRPGQAVLLRREVLLHERRIAPLAGDQLGKPGLLKPQLKRLALRSGRGLLRAVSGRTTFPHCRGQCFRCRVRPLPSLAEQSLGHLLRVRRQGAFRQQLVEQGHGVGRLHIKPVALQCGQGLLLLKQHRLDLTDATRDRCRSLQRNAQRLELCAPRVLGCRRGLWGFFRSILDAGRFRSVVGGRRRPLKIGSGQLIETRVD